MLKRTRSSPFAYLADMCNRTIINVMDSPPMVPRQRATDFSKYIQNRHGIPPLFVAIVAERGRI